VSHTCARCPNQLRGRDLVCGRCRDAERLCQDCGREHGGRPTTRYCAPCRSKRRRKPVRYPFTPEMDQAIRDVYASGEHGRKALAILMRRLDRPLWSIQCRARKLGCATTRTKEAPWSDAELEILSTWAWMSPERVRLKLAAAGHRRTTTAVAVMMKRRRVRATADGTTATGLAEIIGHDASTVARWIRHGKLKAEKRGDGERDSYYVTDDAFRAFVLRHVELVDLGKIERAGSKLWLVDLLSGGKVGGKRAA